VQPAPRAFPFARLALIPVLAAALGATACAGDEPPAAVPGAPVQALPQHPGAAPGGPPAVAVSPSSLPPDLLEALLRDAATVASADPADVRVVAVDAVTWPDSSLGCGRPDESALQVLTPGYRIVIEVRGARLNYHTDRRRGFRICPQGAAAAPAPHTGTPVDR
jgi:hypothetical protein